MIGTPAFFASLTPIELICEGSKAFVLVVWGNTMIEIPCSQPFLPFLQDCLQVLTGIGPADGDRIAGSHDMLKDRIGPADFP